MIIVFLVILLSFLLGSIPSGYLIAKVFYGVDIRQHGSGNTGATNVLRTVGKLPAIVTFLLDVAKGFIPVFISRKLIVDVSIVIPMMSGFCAIAGHIWTPFLRFKGGKGVATGCGVFLGLSPLATIFSLIVFLIVLAVTKYVSIGSMAAAITLPVFLYFLNEPLLIVYVSVILAAIIIWRHKSNIRKILKARVSCKVVSDCSDKKF